MVEVQMVRICSSSNFCVCWRLLLASSPEAISAYFADCAANFDILFATLYINGDDAIELYEQGNCDRNFWRRKC